MYAAFTPPKRPLHHQYMIGFTTRPRNMSDSAPGLEMKLNWICFPRNLLEGTNWDPHWLRNPSYNFLLSSFVSFLLLDTGICIVHHRVGDQIRKIRKFVTGCSFNGLGTVTPVCATSTFTKSGWCWFTMSLDLCSVVSVVRVNRRGN